VSFLLCPRELCDSLLNASHTLELSRTLVGGDTRRSSMSDKGYNIKGIPLQGCSNVVKLLCVCNTALWNMNGRPIFEWRVAA